MSRALLLILAIALVIVDDARMSAVTTRARVRAELTREILDAARARLAEQGSAALSLRAVARDVGMVSSAVYRYFPSRDDLLTALIVDAYDSIGAAVEAAQAPVSRSDVARRWSTICRAARGWAREHPHEYALIYGSPVPGYRAPETTIAPATRVALTLVQLLLDTNAAGVLAAPPLAASTPRALSADLVRLREVFADVPDPVIVRALIAWSTLYGTISFELFGQFHNVVDASDAYFDLATAELAAFVGLPGPRRRTGAGS